MKRGDIVLVREPGTPAGKSRPCVVVQRESTLARTSKLTVVPLTSRLRGAQGDRPLVVPSPVNHLTAPCEAQFDWIYTHAEARIGKQIGVLEPEVLDEIDEALRRWLDL